MPHMMPAHLQPSQRCNLEMSCLTHNSKQYGICEVGDVVKGHHIFLMQGWTLLGDLCPRFACSPLLPRP